MIVNYTQNKEVAWRMVEGEAVLVHPRRSEVKILNEVGSRIWGLCEEGSSLEKIVEAVCEEFDVSPEQARADAGAFLREMEEKGLILRDNEAV